MKQLIHTENAPKAIGPYSQAIKVSGQAAIYVSGQLPADPATGIFPDGIQAQTRQALSNVRAILEEAGAGLANVVKTTVFLADIQDFAAMNEVYAEFFAEPFPARAAFQAANLPKQALVEIEAVAVV